MSVYLLDINLLLALAWPNHLHHERAHAWMADVSSRKWATCPLTEAGFLRLSCNPRVVGVTVLPFRASQILAANTAQPDHEFWPDDVPVVQALAPFGERLVGHLQVSNAYLLGLAIQRKGVLATLDTGIAALLPKNSPHLAALETLTV
jgi:toxin-antitoxin system PIN domain toxin